MTDDGVTLRLRQNLYSDSLPCEHFPKMRKFAQSHACLRNYVQMRAVIFFHENNQKQTEVAMVRFQLEELSVAFSYEFKP